MPSICTKYCILATLLLTFLPGDITYVAVAGLFLSMKVTSWCFKANGY